MHTVKIVYHTTTAYSHFKRKMGKQLSLNWSLSQIQRKMSGTNDILWSILQARYTNKIPHRLMYMRCTIFIRHTHAYVYVLIRKWISYIACSSNDAESNFVNRILYSIILYFRTYIRRTSPSQCFLHSRNIGQVTPKIIYFHCLFFFPWIKVSEKYFISFWKRKHWP